MSRLAFPEVVRAWFRRRKRWPLTRQIAMLFAVLMVANGLLISTALNYWGRYQVEKTLAKISPQARQIYRRLEKGNEELTVLETKKLNDEFRPFEAQLKSNIDTALYIMIALAGLLTMGAGYLILGRLGRGLGSVALAARRIADGDLTARATQAGFASREEMQLISDFNAMSAALQRAEREMAESTAAIAHELRTPLTILRGRLHGIADGVFALEAREVQGLLDQVEGLARLVDDLQTLSLANSQRLVLNMESTDLADEVHRLLASVGPDLETAGLKPVLALSTAPLVADGARIRQAVSAVLANACRYASGSGPLRIATHSDPVSAILEIVDNGPGLPEGSDDVAFDRFWRGEASRSRNSGGSGLGLSVVRAIVEAHGGSASLSNHASGGALFKMRLPRAKI